MGSFLDSPDGLLKLAATAAGGAAGGPVGAGLANFGSSMLTGEDPMKALQSSFMAGAGSNATGAMGSAAPTVSSVGSDFLNGVTNGLGFGNVATPTKNTGYSLLDTLNAPTPVPTIGDFNLNVPQRKPTLLDTLNFRSQY